MEYGFNKIRSKALRRMNSWLDRDYIVEGLYIDLSVSEGQCKLMRMNHQLREGMQEQVRLRFNFDDSWKEYPDRVVSILNSRGVIHTAIVKRDVAEVPRYLIVEGSLRLLIRGYKRTGELYAVYRDGHFFIVEEPKEDDILCPVMNDSTEKFWIVYPEEEKIEEPEDNEEGDIEEPEDNEEGDIEEPEDNEEETPSLRKIALPDLDDEDFDIPSLDEPDDPEDPEDPETPKDPEDPETPEDPEDPEEPEEPEDPEEPEEPEEPEDPEEPVTPEEPDDENTPEEPGEDSGDDGDEGGEETPIVVMRKRFEGYVRFGNAQDEDVVDHAYLKDAPLYSEKHGLKTVEEDEETGFRHAILDQIITIGRRI